jgi:undecaprenyl-diphosphatase
MWQALILGALQGVAELFPVSSLAQTILIPALLGWNFGPDLRERPDFLAFVVALHLATAVALFIYFWKDWREVVAAFIGSAKKGKLIYDEPSKFAWLLIAGTVVVGLMGLVFEKKLRQLFEDPSKSWIVAAVLALNGFGERASERKFLFRPRRPAGTRPSKWRRLRRGKRLRTMNPIPPRTPPTSAATWRI